VLVGEDQYLGAGPEAMVEAGVSADGNVHSLEKAEKELP